jgi:hypothetical protein
MYAGYLYTRTRRRARYLFTRACGFLLRVRARDSYSRVSARGMEISPVDNFRDLRSEPVDNLWTKAVDNPSENYLHRASVRGNNYPRVCGFYFAPVGARYGYLQATLI